MVRKRGPLLIVVSLLLGLVAAWIANVWITSRASAETQPVRYQVVTAAMDIPLGTQIEERHLATLEMLPGSQPKGSYNKKAQVAGKVARSPILAGEIILEPRITEQGSGSALAAVVAKDMRAITVRVDDVVGVGGFLLPGNRVDVLATHKEGNAPPVTETILSNVKVLAVDQTAAADSNQPVVVRAVTLEVTPDDAEAITKGKAAGTLQLTLRNPLDDSVRLARKPEPGKVIVKRSVVVAPPVEKPSVTVIRGTEVGQSAVRN